MGHIYKNVNKVITFVNNRLTGQISYTFLLRFFWNQFVQRWCMGKNRSPGHMCFFVLYHGFLSTEYRPFCHRPVFTSKAWILTFWPLTSIEVWGQWHYIARISIVIDQGSFHKVDNDLKFTNIWELAHLPKSTKPQLPQSVDFIMDLTFWNRTYSKSPQNFRSYDILRDHVASL